MPYTQSSSGVPLIRSRTDDHMWKLFRVEELFRIKDTEVPAQLVATFCYIASHNPCHLQAINDATGLSTNSVSRNTDWLSDWHRLGKPGMGLIKKEVDPTNKRRKIVRLTPRGEGMVRQIKEILYGDY